jgi:hypothetical protein
LANQPSIGGFRKPYTEQTVGSEWDVKDHIGGTEEWAMSTWIRKRGNEKCF